MERYGSTEEAVRRMAISEEEGDELMRQVWDSCESSERVWERPSTYGGILLALVLLFLLLPFSCTIGMVESQKQQTADCACSQGGVLIEQQTD